MINPNYVRIFDTTLRDGEQSPGATLTSNEKLEIARGLARLGVDVIEAGFPAASPDDLEGVRRIAIEVGNSPPNELGLSNQPPVICGLAHALQKVILMPPGRLSSMPHGHAFTPSLQPLLSICSINCVWIPKKWWSE